MDRNCTFEGWHLAENVKVEEVQTLVKILTIIIIIILRVTHTKLWQLT